MTVADDGVLREAGDEQYLETWPGHPRRVRNLPPVHPPRKPHVSDQEIDPCIGLEIRMPEGPSGTSMTLYPASKRISDMSMRTVGPSSMTSTVSPDPTSGMPGSSMVSIPTSHVAGEIQAHGRSLADFRIDPHLAARLADESVHHGKAEARALADWFGGEERIENTVDDVLRHP
jgi:hypothetical protein